MEKNKDNININVKHRSGNQVQSIAKQIKEELTEESDIDITAIDIGSLTWMITEHNIPRFDYDEYQTMRNIIPKIITDKNDNQSFSIIDIGPIIRQYKLWMQHLPNVEPFYAVKCNSDPIVLRTLASLGVGFDVASKGEITMAIESNANREKIIYANPCKGIEHIRFARSQEISLMTFDNKNELSKIALYHPDAQLILRILVDDITKSKMQFGCKFGCPMNDVADTLKYAKFHDLNVVGVSFHVGSACLDPKSYSNAIKRAKEIFDMAKEIGYNFNILDIGGGFPGYQNNDNDDVPSFIDISNEIQSEINNSFNDIENFRTIAEPGRFFATGALTLVVSVTNKKSIKMENTDTIFHYYIDSSIYGMFNNIIFDKANIEFQLLNKYSNKKTYKSVIFGETCDSMDKIIEGIDLPELACGDYLFVENHGAYTIASSSSFNGFPIHKPIYIFTY